MRERERECVCVSVCRTKNAVMLRWNAPAANGSAIIEYCLEWDQGTGQYHHTCMLLLHGLLHSKQIYMCCTYIYTCVLYAVFGEVTLLVYILYSCVHKMVFHYRNIES